MSGFDTRNGGGFVGSGGGSSSGLQAANNLSELTPTAATARTNLGLGSAATLEAGVSNGVATLDANGKIPSAQVPAIAITDSFVVASQAAMLALSAQTGDVAIRTDQNKTYILQGADPTVLGNWQELRTPTDAVQSVNGQTGAVTITAGGINALDAFQNLADITDAATARANLHIDKVTTFNNANYTVLPSDKTVLLVQSLTAPRTVQLPLAADVNPGYEIIIADSVGGINSGNTLTITRAGADTIAGANTEVIGAAYGMRRLISDGVSRWSMDRGVLRASNNLSDVASASTARTNIGAETAGAAATAQAFAIQRANHTGTQASSTISDFNSATRAQVEAELVAGTNVTITPSGSGATRQLTIAATGGGGSTTWNDIKGDAVTDLTGRVNTSTGTTGEDRIGVAREFESIQVTATGGPGDVTIFAPSSGEYIIQSLRLYIDVWTGMTPGGGANVTPKIGATNIATAIFVSVGGTNVAVGAWWAFSMVTSAMPPIKPGGSNNLILNVASGLTGTDGKFRAVATLVKVKA
jgi:hypothetical protein